MQRERVEMILQHVMMPRHLRAHRVGRVSVRIRAEPVRFPIHDVKAALVLEEQIDEALDEPTLRLELQPPAAVGAAPSSFVKASRFQRTEREIKLQLIQRLRGSPVPDSRPCERRSQRASHHGRDAVRCLGRVEVERCQLPRDEFIDRRRCLEIQLLEDLVQANAGARTAGERVRFPRPEFRPCAGAATRSEIRLLRSPRCVSEVKLAMRQSRSNRCRENCARAAARSPRSRRDTGGLPQMADRRSASASGTLAASASRSLRHSASVAGVRAARGARRVGSAALHFALMQQPIRAETSLLLKRAPGKMRLQPRASERDGKAGRICSASFSRLAMRRCSSSASEPRSSVRV
jgi:hypothetical protein